MPGVRAALHRDVEPKGSSSRTLQVCPGSEAASAVVVRLGAAVLRAIEPFRSRGVEGTDGVDSGERQPPSGQRARLVGADGVDVAQRLDRVHLLHEGAPPTAPRGAEGVGDRDEEEQAVGDQARQHGGGLHDAHEGEPLQRGLEQDRRAHQRNQQHDQPDHERDAPLQGCPVGAGAARVGGEAAGVAGRTHVPSELMPVAADAEAARQQLVAGLLDLGFRLPGEEGFVDVDPSCAEERSVHDQLVAGSHVDHVSAHDLVGEDLDVPPVAHDGDPAAVEQLQAVELALGADLLGRADARVEQSEAHARDGVAVPAECQQCCPDDEQDQVEEGEDVGAQDPGVAARGRTDRDVPWSRRCRASASRWESPPDWSSPTARVSSYRSSTGPPWSSPIGSLDTSRSLRASYTAARRRRRCQEGAGGSRSSSGIRRPVRRWYST